MNGKILLLASVAVLSAGLMGCEVHEHYEYDAHPRHVHAPAPVPVYAAPVYVEEGARYGGAVVTAYDAREYVWVNGGWYYYHPGMRVWVHAHRAGNWHPPREVRVYQSWGEHPMYKAPAGHPPAVVAPPAPVRPVPVVAPAYVEEGARVNGAVVVMPANVEFVLVSGSYYYYHPSMHVWVHAKKAPPRGAHVYKSWGEHPAYRAPGADHGPPAGGDRDRGDTHH